jgi:hypothetical protein
MPFSYTAKGSSSAKVRFLLSKAETYQGKLLKGKRVGHKECSPFFLKVPSLKRTSNAPDGELVSSRFEEGC